MSTHGFVGLRVDGKDFLQYNHSSSYPKHFGLELISTIKAISVERFRQTARSWVLVDAGDEPSEGMLEKLHPLLAEPRETYPAMLKRMREHATTDPEAFTWYQVLRQYQGDLAAWVENGIPVWPHGDWLTTSWDIEWGYLINCDEEHLEVYTGRYKHKARPSYPKQKLQGRYREATSEDPDDRPITLLCSVPLEELLDLPDLTARAWCVELERKTSR
jgi:hypothetical protein